MRGGMHAKRGVRNFAAAIALRVIALTVINFSALCSGSAVAAETADTVYENARIYTVDVGHPWASALAVRANRLIGIGSEESVAALKGPATKVVDLNRAFVMPGFIDVHTHIAWGGQYLNGIGLRDATTMAEVLRRVESYVAAHPGGGWIQGEAWSYGYPDLEGGEFHKEMLDRIVPDRPVYLSSSMAHAAWVNTKALELAGITRDTPDPPGGIIARDANGQPTGWLKEEPAIDLVGKHITASTPADLRAAFKAAFHEAGRLGITRFDSAGMDFSYLDLLGELEHSGELTVRLEIADVVNPPGLTPELLAKYEAARRRYHDDWLSVVALKFFMDGVIESHTAWLPDGYADDPKQTGLRQWEPAAYKAAVRAAAEHGFQVYTHAIGDGAVKLTLDAYEEANAATAGKPSLRHRIEHMEALYPSDIPRFGHLGVIASMQPAMIYPRDEWMGMEHVWPEYAGQKRVKTAFALRSILDAHGVLAFGTDWPTVRLDPVYSLRNAALRQSLDGQPAGGYVPSERITVPQAIRAYTLDAAFASHREKQEGSLEVGKLADFVVLSNNLLEMNPQEIAKVTVLRTIVGGRQVYAAP